MNLCVEASHSKSCLVAIGLVQVETFNKSKVFNMYILTP